MGTLRDTGAVDAGSPDFACLAVVAQGRAQTYTPGTSSGAVRVTRMEIPRAPVAFASGASAGPKPLRVFVAGAPEPAPWDLPDLERAVNDAGMDRLGGRSHLLFWPGLALVLFAVLAEAREPV